MKGFIKDLTTGKVREYGADHHDSLVISKDGRTLAYENLQCGDDSRYGDYRFCDEDGTIPGEDEVLIKHGADAYFNIGGFKNEALEQELRWIPVSEMLPETDNENSINSYNVLLWVKNKTYPEREPQIYLGKLKHIDGDDGSGNFWNIETKPCDWAIWGWCYFNEPEVIAWMPLPEPYKVESEEI